MNLLEIQTTLKTSAYDFLSDRHELNTNLILIGLGGSHAYGTETSDSDLDLRGVATNTKEYILTGRDFEQFVDVDTDTTIYSFDKIIKLLCSCNPNVIELLGLKPEHYLYCNEFGTELISNKHLFLSKRAIHTFGGYADSQLRRLENKATRETNQSGMEKHILNSIRNASYVFRERYHEMPDDAIKLYIDKAVQPDYDTEVFMDIALKHYPLRDYADMVSEMKSIVRQYAKMGHRNQNAAAHNKIGKHMMHLVRLYLMCFDILEKGEIVTYREKERDFLMEIRNGKYLDDNDQPIKEFYDIIAEYENKLRYLSDHTELPDNVDMNKINQFVADINERIVVGG